MSCFSSCTEEHLQVKVEYEMYCDALARFYDDEESYHAPPDYEENLKNKIFACIRKMPKMFMIQEPRTEKEDAFIAYLRSSRLQEEAYAAALPPSVAEDKGDFDAYIADLRETREEELLEFEQQNALDDMYD